MVVMASDGRSSASPQPTSDGPPSSLTIRMIMQGKEVGSIIGKKGDNVKKYREESGAKINISDSSCPERIVTVTGSTDGIYKAFSMICSKFEEDINALPSSGVPKPPVTVRLIVPASQCGSLIGKGGAKIKEIRETTGALIQVASEMLPNSTERTVTISGSADAITKCILHICYVMQESPPKGATIPYRPKPAMAPVLVAGPGGIPIQVAAGPGGIPIQAPDMAKMAAIQGGIIPGHPGAIPFIQTNQGLIPAASLQHPAALHPGQFPRPAAPAGSPQAHEMTIPNDLIGCIIGRGGSKINEIRQLSGANIKIANVEEGSSDRKVTIMGTADTISTAQYLINARITTEVCGMGLR